jgi:hypothetical protein
MIKSNFDEILFQPFNVGKRDSQGRAPFSKFVQRNAAKNMLRIIAGQAAAIIVAEMILPDSVEDDPTSSDFGKIKVGNTRFDISGGSLSMFVLAMRLAKGSFKASSGRTVELDSSGFGGMDSMDLIWNFLENKMSPAVAAAKDSLTIMHDGQDWRTGKEMKWTKVVNGLVVPLPAENLVELMEDPDSAPVLVAMIAEIFGISTLNYKSKFKASR